MQKLQWTTLKLGQVQDLAGVRIDAEVQIRTLPQSEWANVYEGLGELFGRGIRYGEQHEDTGVQQLVDQMQNISTRLADAEEFTDTMWRLERVTEAVSPPITPKQAEILEKAGSLYEQNAEAYANTRAGLQRVLEGLRDLRRKIKEQQEV